MTIMTSRRPMTIIASKQKSFGDSILTLVTILICALSFSPNRYCASTSTKSPEEGLDESSARLPAEAVAPPPQPKTPSLHLSNLSTADLDHNVATNDTIPFGRLSTRKILPHAHDPDWSPPAPTDPPTECTDSLFRCATNKPDGHVQCIPISWKCDREYDCHDRSDEDESAKCPPATCSSSQFQCVQTKNCIPLGWRCDGDDDCGDKSDEESEACRLAGNIPPGGGFCPPNMHRCIGSDRCIRIQALCDGTSDCADHSDEGNHCQRRKCLEAKCAHGCKESLGGPRCFCGPFQAPNGTDCLDINECELKLSHMTILNLKPCDQKCVNTNGSYECSCVEGFRYIGNGSCVPINVPETEQALLVFTTIDAIQATTLTGFDIKPKKFHLKSDTISAMDINHRNKTVCWITTKTEKKMSAASSDAAFLGTLQCASMENSTIRWTISFPQRLDYVDQMAYDWIGSNWYFVDDIMHRIFLCTWDGASCITVVDKELQNPRGIAVDPTKGFLFFANWGAQPKLERASLDGTKRSRLVSQKIVYPRGISLDYANEHVYWTDSYLNHVQRIDYDGTNRITVAEGSFIDNVFELSAFGKWLYLTEGTKNHILRMEKHNESRYEVIKEDVTVGTSPSDRPGSIHVYHRQMQPSLPNNAVHPCSRSDRGGCDHVCIVSYESDGSPSTLCRCRAGFRLESNEGKGKCISALTEKFLIFANAYHGIIRGVNTEPQETNEEVLVPISPLESPQALDFYAKENMIYFSDSKKYLIGKRSVNGTGHIETIIDSGINKCEGLAIDFYGGNIYFTDVTQKTISVASLRNATWKKTLVIQPNSFPRSIVVHPKKGTMYWTDWSGSGRGFIRKAGMDGFSQEALVEKQLLWPNGLTLDYQKNHLYWCDAFLDKIERIDIDGSNRRLIYDDAVHPLYLALSIPREEESDSTRYLFWAERRDGIIRKYDMDRNETVILRKENPRVEDLVYFDPDVQRGSNQCSDVHTLGCQYLCLTTPTGAVCACPDGMKLDSTGVGCKSIANYTTPPICQKDQFECKNRKCISNRWLCDGDDDCSDQSDEDNGIDGVCNGHSCNEDQYRCPNNRCIPIRWLCDGDNDCKNSEDENSDTCSKQDCPANQFRCVSTKRCIPESWKCDLDEDCIDGSDEPEDCDYPTCPFHYFACDNHHCIPQNYVCDNDDDCRDGSDEKNCEYHNCSSTDYLCPDQTPQKCLRQEFKCDGVPDCTDGSDESDCPTATVGNCEESEFACVLPEARSPDVKVVGPVECVRKEWRCDREQDCINNADETDCPEVNGTCSTFQCGPVPPSSVSKIRYRGDPVDQPAAGDVGGRCIPNKWQCDGRNDCLDNSDEAGCDVTVQCAFDELPCASNDSHCVSLKKFCDGKKDCPNGEDEDKGGRGFCSEDVCGSLALCSHNCTNIPTEPGYLCSCPEKMKLGDDDYHCVYVNPCDKWGICSQKCVDVPGYNRHNYKCECLPGFQLDDDGFTCKSKVTTPLSIVFSIRHDISKIDLDGPVYSSLASGLRNPIAIDFHYEQKFIFWTDVVDDKVYRGLLNSHSLLNIEPIISTGLATPEGLAVDWVAGNLYWVESNLDQIEVARLNGSMRATLVAGSMESPRAIVLDPHVGMLFWTDWDSQNPRIESCSLSGANRTTIFDVGKNVSEGGWPNGLTLDYDNQRLYWIDARSDSIHAVDYFGHDHHEILRGHDYLMHPFAISLYGNHVYWTDWHMNWLLRANKWNGSDVHVVWTTTRAQPFDIQIFHPSRQPYSPNPCLNASCSHLCLLSFNGTYECKCPHFFKLDPNDNATCLEHRVALLMSRQTEIRGIDLDEPEKNFIPSITVSKVQNASVVDYDGRDDFVYWTDLIQGVINRAHVNGSGVTPIIDSDIPNPYGFAIDWVGRNMFFSSFKEVLNEAAAPKTGVIIEPDVSTSDKDTSATTSASMKKADMLTYTDAKIQVAKLDGAFRVTIVDSNLVKPMSVVVHPYEGRLFWSDHGNDDVGYKIEVSDMDGGQRRIISDKFASSSEASRILSPVSLTIDFEADRLFWVNRERMGEEESDVTPGSIASCAFDGSDLRIVFVAKDEDPFALALYNGDIFYSSLSNAQILKISDSVKESVGNDTSKPDMASALFRGNTENVKSMLVFDQNKRDSVGDSEASPCAKNNGNCSQLCLAVSQKMRKCKCTSGYKLKDGAMCRGITSFLMYSVDTEIRGITVDEAGGLPDAGSTDSTPSLATISHIKMAVAIDFYAAEDYIYWVDRDAVEINRIKRDLTERETVINDGLGMVTGLAIDWIAGHIYWTDMGFDVIEVAHLNGSHRFVVVSGDLESPKAIVLAAHKGLMFWADSAIHKIERANLDGSDRQIIVNKTDLLIPVALAVDFDNDLLFWIDSRQDSIKSVKFDGTDLTAILENSNELMDPYGITVFGDNVYWTDRNKHNSSIKRVDKNTKDIDVLKSDLGQYLKDIKFYGRSRQPPNANSPCTTRVVGGDYGNCSELCLMRGETERTCQCAHGEMGADGVTCEDFDSFLLYSKATKIDSLQMFAELNRNSPMKPISFDTMRNVIALAVDYNSSRLFFSDVHRHDIQMTYFNGTDSQVLKNEVGSVEGIAFESSMRELYWTSYSHSSIYRLKIKDLDLKHIPEPTQVVRLQSEDHPRAIAIDSCESRMYWTNWNERQPSIQRSYLTGWKVESIIVDRVGVPNGLAIDHKAQKLYWSDARLDKIERCEMDGTNRVVVLRDKAKHPFGLAVYGDFIYWTDWILRAVVRVNKHTFGEVTFLSKNLMRQPMGIVAVAPDADDCTLNPCLEMNGGCSDKCAVTPKGEVDCQCWEGRLLADDLDGEGKKRCVDRANVTCTENEFECRNGLCIPYRLTCDGVDGHCTDGSDEDPTFCATRVCPERFFSCRKTKRCVLESEVCDRKNDCGDHSDESDCTCVAEEFRCKQGMCVRGSDRCNRRWDCPDVSDEIGCPPLPCNSSDVVTSHRGESEPNISPLFDFIPCNTTTNCILTSWICDGQNDCWDNSDEIGCPTQTVSTCASGGFSCNNNKCIPHTWRCDRDDDCGDHSDEASCSYTCDGNQFTCNNSLCIPASWACDGAADCDDKSDEKESCKERQCKEKEFKCNNTGRCIPTTWLCDGDNDCGDERASDEHPDQGCAPLACQPDEYQCANYHCIRMSFACDGEDDCGDQSDEPDTCTYQSCGKDQFQCKGGRCIPNSHKCNGVKDCPDSSDEDPINCPTSPPQPSDGCKSADNFKCKANDLCIPRTLLCNGIRDCPDHSDEENCNVNECEGAHPCQHTCKDEVVGFKCRCRSGYRLMNDSASCEDINECDDLPCSHFCLNNPGSFKCVCAHGFRLEIDKKRCVLSEMDPVKPQLLVSNRYYIRSISLGGNVSRLVARDLTNAVALDFDYMEQKIYWSDVTSTASTISSMIYSKNVTENLKTKVILHDLTVKNPDGLAVDWIGRNLYWCDKGTDSIEVSKLDGSYRKVLVSTDLREPRAIVLDPYRGYLYWTDWGDKPYIGKIGMDGTNRTHIVTEDVGWPNALTICYITKHLFWGDAREDVLMMSDLEGRNRRVVLSTNLPHIFALTMFEDYLYWSDWELKAVVKAHKYSGKNREQVTKMIHRPMDLQVLHSSRQKPLNKPNPCENNGGCSNLCLLSPDGKRMCACPENFHLADDKKSCLANCTASQFICQKTYKCIPFWWKCDRQNDCGDFSDEPKDCGDYNCHSPGLFQCKDKGNCIVPTQICDGKPQCSDNSDEEHCETYACMNNQFKCGGDKKPKCIPEAWRCDNTTNCDNGEDEENCEPPSCDGSQFQCKNGRCIPYVWNCDGDNDCGDNSDEPNNCKDATCPVNYMKCNTTGKCIPDSWRCDGDDDCGDSSDEPTNQCAEVSCERTYFKCANNRCIPGRWRCDYDDDCRDNSDEDNCVPRECSESEFRCNDGRCIQGSWRCDGERNCQDGSDEFNCTVKCTASEFKCKNTGFCIPSQWKCDNDQDCTDGSDEFQCQKSCSTNEFSCNNTLCISKLWLCDGEDDCGDSSDEIPALCKNIQCTLDRFQCHDSRICIPRSRVCNGENNCNDGSDERLCAHASRNCTSGEWKCGPEGGSGGCIPKDRVCDSFLDCSDHSDEANCLTGSCANHTCQHDCHNTSNGRGYYCECRDGFQLTRDGKTACVDVNECQLFGKCSQRCINQVGSYYCLCAPKFDEKKLKTPLHKGYNKTCRATGDPPYLLLSDENQLRLLNPFNPIAGSYRDLLNGTGKITTRISAIDVDMSNPQRPVLFWTDHHNNSIGFTTIPPPGDAKQFEEPGSSRSERRRRRDHGDPERDGQPQTLFFGLDDPRGIAVDWVSRLVYWTEIGSKTIRAASLEGNNRKRTIVEGNLERPEAVVVDPEGGRLYWIDQGARPKIEGATLAGQNRSILASKDMQRPTGLAIDRPNGRLYWADPKMHVIESLALDGTGRKVVKSFPRGSDQPFGINIFEDYLYVSTYKTHNVFKIHKYGYDDPVYIVGNLTQVGGLVIVQENSQKKDINNNCKLGSTKDNSACGSDQICISMPQFAKVCLCPEGTSKTTRTDGSEACLPDTPSCANFNCQNGGTCQEGQTKRPKCLCPSRYTGSHCETDRCYGLCLNGGQCKVSALEEGVYCLCKPGFNGTNCEDWKCRNYCNERGLCSINARNEPVCKCSFMFEGDRCQLKNKHPCKGYCVNGGDCSIKKERPFCKCKNKFEGNRCQQCEELICLNGGTCQRSSTNSSSVGAPSCICPPAFRGDRCEHSVCENYCRNNATCSVPHVTPMCQCAPGWGGSHCDVRLCDNYCSNGGNCTVDEVEEDNLRCDCPPSFKGKKCQEDKCKKFCLNGGTCERVSNGVRCSCPTSFEGDRCQNATCGCKNNGTCNYQGQGVPRCKCLEGFTGEYCEKSMRCKKECRNGGTCTRKGSCVCLPNFTGDYCQYRSDSDGLHPGTRDSSGWSSTQVGLAVAIPIVVVIILSLIAVFIYVRHHYPSTRPFQHFRMHDNPNVEISNPMYMKDVDDGDEGPEPLDSAFSLDPDRRRFIEATPRADSGPGNGKRHDSSINFSNPVFETLFQDQGERSSGTNQYQPTPEHKKLLSPSERDGGGATAGNSGGSFIASPTGHGGQVGQGAKLMLTLDDDDELANPNSDASFA